VVGHPRKPIDSLVSMLTIWAGGADFAAIAGILLALPACSTPPVALHCPASTATVARDPATPLDFDPIVVGPGAAISGGLAAFAAPGPELVLTSGLAGELRARSPHGGEPGGYRIRCRLDRFALRQSSNMTETHAMASLYADLMCEAARRGDGATVWRGELRGRAASAASSGFSTDLSMVQRLADRMMSDVVREMSADLAVRALGLSTEASGRVFADEQAQHDLAGMDDSTFGTAALAEDWRLVPTIVKSLASLEPMARAAGWNAVAMAAGPGDAWTAGDHLRLDEDPLVRFYQYKALARLGSPTALGELGRALDGEDEPLLAELVQDALSTGGIGFARTHANAATSGATTSP
jgi:hypothetical protein